MRKNGKTGVDSDFSQRLLGWNRDHNTRQMPWKGEKNPYRIWLSEIILQQTRVEQGLRYYNSFISTFPDIHHLARATDEKVFKLWEGLGYYSRCRNLLVTARYISNELKGKFPSTYEEIKGLKGIGPYTAAAISSFAFNLPYAVVDGNVFRVLARVFGVFTATDSTAGKKYFTQLADELLDKNQPGVYNQAIMDFGAVICKPAVPLCNQCPFNRTCYAYLNNKINELPVKEKKISIRKRWFYYFIIETKDHAAIVQRTAKDIWQQLYEYPLIETEGEEEAKKMIAKAEKAGWIRKGEYELVSVSPLYKQQLSHQLIVGRFINIKLKRKSSTPKEWQWVKENELAGYAFPGFINQYSGREQSLF
jgi:A/G-specific adenine glycosylase